MKEYPLLRLADKIYKHAFPVYYPMYVIYKSFRDRDEMGIIRSLVKPGDTVVDIGANIGVITRLLAKSAGISGRVYAFEPAPDNFLFLKRNVGSLANVNIYHSAVGDQDGNVDLYVSDDLNVDHRTYHVYGRKNKLNVDCVRIDSMFFDKKINFIKMDIQGYEYAALCGMKKTISSPACRFVLMELWPFGLIQAGASCRQAIRLLDECGFVPKLLRKGRFVEFSEELVECSETRYYTLLAEKTGK
jgi:FkbM family methyltransferase